MELRDYLNVIRARKWIIIQSVLIVTLTAIVVSLMQAPTYSAEVKVLVSKAGGNADVLGGVLSGSYSPPERDLATQVQIMQIRTLAERTVRKLNLQMPPGAVLGKLSIDGVGDTDVVAIRVTDTDPQRAADIANTIAEEYVTWSRDTRRESIKLAADQIQTRLDEAKIEILALGRKINAQANKKVKPGQPSRVSADWSAQLNIATGLYTTLAQQLEQLRVQEQLETGLGRLVEAAVVNPAPIGPDPVRNAILGVAVGLVFGLGMAFLLEYLDNTIKSTEEAEKVYAAPVLGHIPAEKFEKAEARRLTITQHSGSPAAEAYRVVRNSLEFINFEHDIKTVLVTSSAPGEGKSTVAANLAMGLAQTGSKVVLVNCDFRRPTTDQFFQVSNMIGLSDVMLDRNTLKSALQRPTELELLVLVSGKMPPNPSELLGSTKMADLVNSLREWADWVIVDSPPLLAVADAAAVARWADGVLLVTRGGTSTRDAAKKGREMLDKVGGRTLGVVVWGLEEASTGRGYGYAYDGYHQQYHYSSYYRQSKPGTKAAKKGKKGYDSVAAATADTTEFYGEPKSTGRRVAEFLGKLMAGLLAFLAVLAVLLVALYFADRMLGWGLVDSLTVLVRH